MNIYTYCLQDGYIYSNLKKNGEEIYENFTKCLLYATRVFLLRKFLTIEIPKSMVLVIIFGVFIFQLSFKKRGGEALSIFRVLKRYFKKRTRSSYNETKNNGISLSSSDYETTPKNLGNVLRKFSMPNSTFI